MTTAAIRPRTIRLRRPVTVDGRTYSELTVRSPEQHERLAAYFRGGEPGEVGRDFTALMCGVERAVIDLLTPGDAERVGRAVNARIARV